MSNAINMEQKFYLKRFVNAQNDGTFHDNILDGYAGPDFQGSH